MPKVLATIVRSLRLVGPRWQRRWLGLIPIGLITALLEMAAAVAVFVLVRLISDPSAVDSIRWLAPLKDWSGESSRAALTTVVACLVAALFLIKMAIRLGEVIVRQRCTQGCAADLAGRVLRAYLDAPYAFHLRRNSAELVHSLQDGVRAVSGLALQSATTALTELLMVGGVLIVLVRVTPGVLLLVAVGVALLSIAMLMASQRRVAALGKVLHERGGRRLRALQHGLQGAKDLKLLGRSDFFAERFDEECRQLAAAEISWGTLQWVPRLAVETVFVCGLAGVIVISQQVDTESWLLAPMLGIFAYAAMRLLPSLHLIIYHLNCVQLAAPAVAQLYREYTRLAAERRTTAAPPAARLRFADQIRFEQVSFTYERASGTALHQIDFVIRRGESIGVVGTTGAGKSTLVDLLLGLLAPSAGRLTVDGIDIQSAVEGWQRQLGYVSQQIYLLDATIRANIAFGIHESAIDDERVRTVARMAQLQPWLATLPEGIDTLVGERGVRLSGGERQRVAIARALYHDPALLVFDEATSALDTQTEQALTDAIAGLCGEKTLILVAHRLTTVRGCNRLLFLRDGRIADLGSYEELLQRDAAFQRMVLAAEGEQARSQLWLDRHRPPAVAAKKVGPRNGAS